MTSGLRQKVDDVLKHTDAPAFVRENVILFGHSGSRLYGVHNEKSDHDYFGAFIPPREMLYSVNPSYIPGFDRQEIYEQYKWEDNVDDITIFSFPKYMRLVGDGNPNMVETLFATDISQKMYALVLYTNKQHFVTKRFVHKMMAFATSAYNTMKTYQTSWKTEEIEKYGYSIKDAYNVIRLCAQIEMIMRTRTLKFPFEGKILDLLLSIRSGEISEKEVNLLYSETLTRYNNNVLNGLPDTTDPQTVRTILSAILDLHWSDSNEKKNSVP